MPDHPQQDVTSFKTRTHHGSGKKETYELKACVFLEDARPANDRALEVPREMRLSLLRWDFPETDGQQEPGTFAATSESIVSNGSAGRPSPSLASREGGDRAAAGGSGDELGGAETTDGGAEDDQFPGDPERPMREEMWMLCNLDEHLLLSQFHPSRGEKEHEVVAPITAAEGFVSSNPYLNKPNGVPHAAAKQDTLPLSGRRTSAVVNGAAAAPEEGAGQAGARSLRGEQGMGSDNSGRYSGRQDSASRSSRPLPPPPIKQPVIPSRREERVTFHARPTCHDFLRGWEGGRARHGGPNLGGGGRPPKEGRDLYASGQGSRGYVGQTSRNGACDDAWGAGASVARGGGGEGKRSGGRSGSGGSGGGAKPRVVKRIVAVGFKSGECAVLDATATNSPSFLSVLNKGGAYCDGRVTAVRFVPGAGRRLFIAAFSTGEAYTFDTSLGKEAPMGKAAEKAAASAAGGAANGGAAGGGGSSGNGSWNGGGGSGGSGGGKRRGSNGKGGGWGGGTAARSGQDSIGSSGSASSSGGGSWGTGRSNRGSSSSSSPALPASFTGGGNAKGDGSSGGRRAGRSGNGGGRTGSGSGSGPTRPSARGNDGFVAERNSVAGANPVSRWRISSDGREVTDMAFAPCEVEGQRLVALVALDGALRVVDYDEQVLVVGFKTWFGGILCLDWSPDGRYIVTGGEDDAVTLWCLETRTCVLRGEGHGSWVTGVAFDYWTSRQPYYRFTSVGEDGRLCMWEHDEMADSLLHGGGGRLRLVPSSTVQHRYKSSENLSRSSKSADNLTRSSKSAENLSGSSRSADNLIQSGSGGNWSIGTLAVTDEELSSPTEGGGTLTEAEGTAAGALVDRETPSALDTTWPIRSKNAISARLGRSASSAVPGTVAATTAPAPDVKQAVAPIAGNTGGGGRRPLTLPSRGVLFFGGVVRGNRGSAGGSADSAAAADNGGGGIAGGKENEAGSAELVYPALSRQSTPRGEPLCCKQLAQMPLSQVMVVRAGVVTLCAEGLLKLWARPTMPLPLPPLPAGVTCLARKKDDGVNYGATGGQPMDGGTASPSAASSSLRSTSSQDRASNGGESSATSTSTRATPSGSVASTLTAEAATGVSATGEATSRAAGGKEASSPLPTALDALINTDIHTPRADAGGAGANGASNGKKKSFFSKGIFSKGSAGRSAGGGRGGGATQYNNYDSAGFSALSAANAKGREPPEVKGGGSSSLPDAGGDTAVLGGSASIAAGGRGPRGGAGSSGTGKAVGGGSASGSTRRGGGAHR